MVFALIKKAPQKILKIVKKIFTKNNKETKSKVIENEPVRVQPRDAREEYYNAWKIFSQEENNRIEKYVANNLSDKYQSYFKKDGLVDLLGVLFKIKKREFPSYEEFIGILKKHNENCEYLFKTIIKNDDSDFCIHSVEDLLTFLKEMNKKPTEHVGLHVLGELTNHKNILGINDVKSFVGVASQITINNSSLYRIIDSLAVQMRRAKIEPTKFLEFVTDDNFSFAKDLLTKISELNLNNDKTIKFLKYYTPAKKELFNELMQRLPQIQKCKLDEADISKSISKDNLVILDKKVH